MKRQLVLFLFALISTDLVLANGPARVVINGLPLSPVQHRALEQQLGMRVLPGNYLVNAAGCWLNLSTGARGCLGGGSDVHSRYGSGARDGSGNWNHWSNAAGGAVGGTSDGCIYTSFGWSNC